MLSLSYFKVGNKKEKVNKVTISKTDDNVEVTLNNLENRTTVTIKALSDIVITKAIYNLNLEIDDKSLFFLNGYQSWTDTKEAYISEYEKFARRAKIFLRRNRNKESFNKTTDILNNRFAFDRYGDGLFYEYDKNKIHGYDVFYIKGKNEFFSFNYNFRNAFLIYEVLRKEKQVRLLSDVKNLYIKKGQEFVLFDFSYHTSINDGLNEFYQYFKEKEAKKIFGYTSWYNYYQNINENIILRDLDALDNKFNLFQIDDGYEKYVGDWLDIDSNKFPNGFSEIVNKIHNKGYKAGIWLAPFIAEKKSKLFKEHKEYFKKDKKGNYIKCGGNWSGFYVLDIFNPEAKEYIKKSLEYYMNLGFDFFKLDFLYAISLPKYDGLSRAMITDIAYKFIRDILKDKLILGCGALPFSSASYFDYLRIGPDVSLEFDDIWFMRYAHRERISTKVTLQNTIYRSIFDKHLFLNDPDVFLLRDDNIKLSKEQKKSLLIINSLFGSVLMTSDDIAKYDKEKKEQLDLAFKLFNDAKDIEFKRRNNYIDFKYNLDGMEYKYSYNTLKGVLING